MFKDVSFQFLDGCDALGIAAASFFTLVAEAIEATKSKKDIAESPTRQGNALKINYINFA
ncbi:MAG: hypothetical protein ACON5F_11835 [Jejuia sp.]